VKAIIITVIVALASTAAPAPVAAVPSGSTTAAEPYRVTRLVARGSFERGGETYRLTIRATDEPEDLDSIEMTIRRTRDPDGDGPAVSRQAHTRIFQALDMMSSESDLEHASIVTDDKLAPHGDITAEFTPTAAGERAPCYGGKRTVRKGRINGTVRVASGTAFGEIVVNAMRARLDSVEGACLPPSIPPPSCPRSGRSLSAQDRDLRMSAFEGRRRLTVIARRESNLPTQDRATDGYVIDSSVTRLPLAHARFAADLSRATVHGLRGTDVRRRVTFSATSAVRRGVEDCYDPARETVERRRRGTVRGTMRFAFFIGPDERLADRNLQGSLTRRRNRPRT
jgi:hypothetical protein